MTDIYVPAQRVKVLDEADVCVIGGSCTGVFAAVAAARLGAKVILVERQNRFGGVATLGLVGMWHSLFDSQEKEQIIAGLTLEMLERMEKFGAVSEFRLPAPKGLRFNPEILTLELDGLLLAEKNIRLLLNTSFSSTVQDEDGALQAVLVENKSGRQAIKARVFIDASGDGLVCKSAGLPMRSVPNPQPPTACARFSGWSFPEGFSLIECLEKYRKQLPELPGSYHWGMQIPGSSLFMLAGTRVLNCDCDDALQSSEAEISARRQIRALLQMLKMELPGQDICLETLPSALGIREGKHIKSIFLLTGEDLLAGKRFPDAIANGTYPVDIHNDQDDSIAFKRLNGDEVVYKGGKAIRQTRWLPEGESLPYYQIPLRCLIPQNSKNLLCAGRMLDADRDAFGAVRVMVNLNQCGQAAGVAAVQALTEGNVQTIDFQETRKMLAQAGAIIL